jgi:hypothetical protein
MTKQHPTFMYFRHKQIRGDGTKEFPVRDVPDGRMQLPFGGYYHYESSVDWMQVAETVAKYTATDATFFLDTSFIGRKEYPEELWDALLARRIVFTPTIWEECEDWFRTPFAHRRFHQAVVDAKTNGSDHIQWLDPRAWGEDIVESARYYVAILAARKLLTRA